MDRLRNSTLNVSSAGNISTNQGTVILNGANSSFPNINSLTVNQGSFTVQGGRTFTTAGALSNSGTVAAGSGSTLTVAGQYNPAPGSITLVDGTLALTGTTNIQGLLSGAGTAQGNLSIAGGSALSPGDLAPGELTIHGNLGLSDNAIYDWSIGSAAESLTHVTGNLTFGSSAVLDVSEFGSTPPQPGTYTLFSVDGTIGTLPTWTYELPSGWAGTVTEVGHSVNLNLSAVPEPSTFILFGIGAISLLAYARRKK